MSEKYGYFNKELGSYTIDKLPPVGSYEYIYKNKETLLKVDQFGVIMAQINPPVGVALVKRENRETASPIRVCFIYNGKTYNNFDVFSADSIKIDYTPQKAVYTLTFGGLVVATELMVASTGMRFVMKVTFRNNSDSDLNLRIMPVVFPYVNELMMAPWDKPEWYIKTIYSEKDSYFLTSRFSIAGKKEERRFFTLQSNLSLTSYELSSERLVADTKNFMTIPKEFSGKTKDQVYAFSQCFAGIKDLKIKSNEYTEYVGVFTTSLKEEEVEKNVLESKKLLDSKCLFTEENKIKESLLEMFSKRNVETSQEDFNKFINGFLPLELDWVSALDRGWPTGMRGVRDASNDFEGYLAYDSNLCRSIIENIFSKQRSDGWYPRQVPFGDSEKFDLRHFVDSACFFTEFVYDYLSYTDDYSILENLYPYYDSEIMEDGITHLKRGIEYLMSSDNIGEHGLVKMQGGDWLDCLNSAGLKGRGETVMVSCQLKMCLEYFSEILSHNFKDSDNNKYLEFADKLKYFVNKCSYNDLGFYNGVFTDEGKWIFSEKDPDGEKRVYVPTNSFSIISGIAEGKEKNVIENIEQLETTDGYKLFSVPFGVKPIDGIGKMGTGDFQSYFAENASVYNHGSQFFYIRALAKVGDYKKLYKVLNYAMPYNENNHKESSVCAAPYAITNCYHLVPSFYGRAGFSFLTGSVAMLERSIYNWMYGINFTLDNFEIKPCIPEEYRDSVVSMKYMDITIKVSYKGFGNRINSAFVDGKDYSVSDGKLVINKAYLHIGKDINIIVGVE